MTPDEKRAGVERLQPWFHRIDLGDAVVTKGVSVAGEAPDHPLPTWKVISEALPADLTGLSVLDVGCNAGFYSVEAKRRGAARVLGIDAQRHQVRQASFVARALGLPMEFRRMSVYDLSPETVGVFDVTLALGLVYHLKHLVQGLERLHSVTRDLLILETAVLLPELVPTNPVPYVNGPLTRSLHPMGYVENSPDAKEAVFNWFVPSVGAMGAMLSDTGFDDVHCVATPGDRAVFVCRKRERSGVQVLPDMAARLEVESAPASCRLGEGVTFEVRATNTGRSLWRARGEGDADEKGTVALGAHLFRGEVEVDWVWARTALLADVPSGASVAIGLAAVAPLEPGRYRVELDLVAEHLSWFEDLGSRFLETVLDVSEEPAPMLWFRVAGLEEGAATAGAAVSAEASYVGLVRSAAAALAGLAPEAQVRSALLWTAGWSPKPSAVDTLAKSLLTGEAGLEGALHALAGQPDARPIPPPPPSERIAAILERAPAVPETAIPLAGESFPGEAAVARGLLTEGTTFDDEAFVRRAYEVVLGRPADGQGLANAAGQLSSGVMTRTHLLQELLWSEELRGL
jgi:tRNA (mo5U34)-methyltransferase